MRVMIGLFDDYVKILSKWASVSRTLNTARRAYEGSDNETYQYCAEELRILTPAIDSMHQASREKMWMLQNPQTKFYNVIFRDNPVAIGMSHSFKDFSITVQNAGFTEEFYIEECSRDQFEYWCQEGRLPIFP